MREQPTSQPAADKHQNDPLTGKIRKGITGEWLLLATKAQYLAVSPM
jgi:hypothetical protein